VVLLDRIAGAVGEARSRVHRRGSVGDQRGTRGAAGDTRVAREGYADDGRELDARVDVGRVGSGVNESWRLGYGGWFLLQKKRKRVERDCSGVRCSDVEVRLGEWMVEGAVKPRSWWLGLILGYSLCDLDHSQRNLSVVSERHAKRGCHDTVADCCPGRLVYTRRTFGGRDVRGVIQSRRGVVGGQG
jgi:hypothetical protein